MKTDANRLTEIWPAEIYFGEGETPRYTRYRRYEFSDARKRELAELLDEINDSPDLPRAWARVLASAADSLISCRPKTGTPHPLRDNCGIQPGDPACRKCGAVFAEVRDIADTVGLADVFDSIVGGGQ